MITEFKIFENTDILQYWKIYNDKDIKISLFKLGMPFNEIDIFVSKMFFNDKAVKAKTLYIISRNAYSGDGLSYSWSATSYEYNFHNTPEIVINQEDREKYDIEEQAIKYNI